MALKIGGHIPSAYGIWTMNPFKGHLVLLVRMSYAAAVRRLDQDVLQRVFRFLDASDLLYGPAGLSTPALAWKHAGFRLLYERKMLLRGTLSLDPHL